jgi:hypothetical protein
MANYKITQLPSASIATGSNVLPIVQDNVTEQITVTNLGQGILNLGLDATFGTVSANNNGNGTNFNKKTLYEIAYLLNKDKNIINTWSTILYNISIAINKQTDNLKNKANNTIIPSADNSKITAFISLWDTYLNTNYEQLRPLIKDLTTFNLFKNSFNEFKKNVDFYIKNNT